MTEDTAIDHIAATDNTYDTLVKAQIAALSSNHYDNSHSNKQVSDTPSIARMKLQPMIQAGDDKVAIDGENPYYNYTRTVETAEGLGELAVHPAFQEKNV